MKIRNRQLEDIEKWKIVGKKILTSYKKLAIGEIEKLEYCSWLGAQN